ncbi:hypothetical protein SUSAZ_04945 [Sulfolobus acidocaldarius SUSAZ]|nr:hypothetical protein SUSAZ_04945 [Sulfolobus acidocaldarius SUSAZ]
MDFVSVGGRKLHFTQSGKGKRNLVLLHGIPGFCYDFRHNVDVLSKKFRVTRIDFKGFGHSEKGDYDVDDFRVEVQAKEIMEALNKLDIHDFVLLGHDIGSIVSQLIAQETNCDLVLINPAYKGMRGRWRDIANEYWYIFFHQIPIAEKMIISNLRDYINYFLDHLTVRKFKEEEKEEYFKVYEEPYSVRALVNWYRAYVSHFRWNNIRKIKSKTLVLWAENDPLFPTSWVDRLWEVFEDYKLVKIREAGHWPHAENPEEVNNAILTFFD